MIGEVKLSQVTRVKTISGAVIEGVLLPFEWEHHLIYNPIPCKCCGNPIGWETFIIIKDRVRV